MKTYKFGIIPDATGSSKEFVYYSSTPPSDPELLQLNSSNQITYTYDYSSSHWISTDTDILSYETFKNIYSEKFGNSYFIGYDAIILNIKSNITDKIVQLVTEDTTVFSSLCPYSSNVRILVSANKTLEASTPVEFDINNIPKYISSKSYIQLIIARRY